MLRTCDWPAWFVVALALSVDHEHYNYYGQPTRPLNLLHILRIKKQTLQKSYEPKFKFHDRIELYKSLSSS